MTNQEAKALDALLATAGWESVIARLLEAAEITFHRSSQIAESLQRTLDDIQRLETSITGGRR